MTYLLDRVLHVLFTEYCWKCVYWCTVFQCMFGSCIASFRRTGTVTLCGHQKLYGPTHV